MINLLTYIAASEPPMFDGETACMARVQIDHSLELGWRPQDILITTDFPFAYQGISSVVIQDEVLTRGRKQRGINKAKTILWLYRNGYLKENVFFHDFDAFQNHPFFECPDPQYLGLDLACAQYGDDKSYNTGCMFFKPAARDLWEKILEVCLQYNWGDNQEERALTLTYPPGQQRRVGVLDISYNVGKGDTVGKWQRGIQPNRIIHFHPSRRGNYAYYVEGKNEINRPLVCPQLGRWLEKHFKT